MYCRHKNHGIFNRQRFMRRSVSTMFPCCLLFDTYIFLFHLSFYVLLQVISCYTVRGKRAKAIVLTENVTEMCVVDVRRAKVSYSTQLMILSSEFKDSIELDYFT
jgi:hypothetical protein